MLEKLKLIRDTVEFINNTRKTEKSPKLDRSDCEILYKSMAMFRNNQVQSSPRKLKLKSSRLDGNIVQKHNLFLDSYITPDLIEMQRT